MDFIEVYKQAVKQDKTDKWIADQLGVSVDSVRSKAKRLRKQGVDLPAKPNAKQRANKWIAQDPDYFKKLRLKGVEKAQKK